MKIAVCLKCVPETGADIRVAADGRALRLDGVELIINPYDEYALEAALRLREQFSGSSVLVLTVGGDEALKCAQYAFALGVSDVLHIRAPGVDAGGAARAAAAALKSFAPDLVLTGRQALDDDQWEFPGTLAELLDMPHVTAVAALEVSADGRTLRCKRRFESVEQTLEAALPAVVSCDRGLNEPRVAKLKGRLAAKRKAPRVVTPEELGLPAAALASAVRLEAYAPPPARKPGRIISGTPAQVAAELARALCEEAKVI
jgi:electron transfer flavoprotein beta subunit